MSPEDVPGHMKRLFVLMLLAAVLAAPGVALALESAEIEESEESGAAAFDQKSAASISDLLQEWREFHTSFGVEIQPRKEWYPRVERWRPLLEEHFLPGDVETGLAVIACESSGDPLAESKVSTAKGLWQHLGKYWKLRSRQANIRGASIWDAEASTIVAAWLVYNTGNSWDHWTCARNLDLPD